MEVFLFVLVLFGVVGVIGGGLLWAVAGHLRRKKLHPEGDLVEGGEGDPRGRPPEHHQVESEQRTTFAGTH